MSRPTRLLAVALAGLALSPLPFTQDAQSQYDRAFRLEHEERAYAEALDLYKQVAGAEGADQDLRARAHRRAHAMSEEVGSADFARLMPPDSILYVEVNRPGQELSQLLSQFGLLGHLEDTIEEGAESFSVSPDLINGLLGARGAAFAINKISLGSSVPGGVLVAHAGDLATVRGLIETALPAGGTPAEPIGGHPTWTIAGQASVTLTARLVVVSPDRAEIAAVLQRLSGESNDSLATASDMRANLDMRRGDLLYVCLNAAPIRPLLALGAGALASQDPAAAVAVAALDLQSLASFVLRAGVDPDGLSMDVLVRLDEGHQNLAFNLLRPAPLDRRTLAMIPAGAAGFVSWSYNQRGPAIASLDTNSAGVSVVSGMDFGREFFANMVGLTLFALPQGSGGPIPDVALVIGANDPERSRAVWNLLLGLANVASPAASMEPARLEIAGHSAERYQLPMGFPLYLVTHESELVLSPSRGAIERILTARTSARSVLDDPAFQAELELIDDGATSVAMLHLGRAVQMGKAYIPQEELAEVGPWMELVDRTVLSAVTRHSDTELGLSVAIRGLPRVDALVAQMIRMERERGQAYAMAYGASSDEGLEATETLLAKGPNPELLRRKFELVAESGSDAEATAIGREIMANVEDPRFLNNLAWALLTEERYGKRFDHLALEMSVVSNEATGHGTWQFLDTLALARFRNGEIEAAIEIETKAIELAPDEDGRQALREALRRFRAALDETVAADTGRIR